MNRSIVALIVAFGLAACGDDDSAVGAGSSLDGAPAASTSGQPLAAETAVEPNCYDVQVERPVDPRDDKRIAGTAIGAVVGGAVGREINDSDFATAAGAAAGAIAGRAAQDRYQENRTEVVTEVRCD